MKFISPEYIIYNYIYIELHITIYTSDIRIYLSPIKYTISRFNLVNNSNIEFNTPVLACGLFYQMLQLFQTLYLYFTRV